MNPFILAILTPGTAGIGIANLTISSTGNVELWPAFKRLFPLNTEDQ